MNQLPIDTKLKPIDSPFIVDTTLRDGEQCPGVVLSMDDKVELLGSMLAIGIREFEIGIPAMGETACAEIIELEQAASRYGARAICWARCHTDDVAACKRIKANAIHVALPVSDLQMKIIGMNRTEIIDRLNRVVRLARDSFSFVSVGAQDATRADPRFLHRYIETASHLGVDRLRLADTVGCGNPLRTYQLIAQLKERFFDLQLELHAHNDFGMATANALAAIQAGADCVSTTILGIGERAGNAPFESVVAASKEVLGVDFDVDTTAIYPLCRRVAQILDIEIPPSQPIVGRGVFSHESGIHTHGQLHHPKAFQPLLAEQIGRAQPNFVFGTHSGRHAVKQLLRNANLPNDDEFTEKIVRQIKLVSRKEKAGLSEQEVVNIAMSQ